jgi:hypothetical protein
MSQDNFAMRSLALGVTSSRIFPQFTWVTGINDAGAIAGYHFDRPGQGHPGGGLYRRTAWAWGTLAGGEGKAWIRSLQAAPRQRFPKKECTL